MRDKMMAHEFTDNTVENISWCQPKAVQIKLACMGEVKYGIVVKSLGE